MKQRFLTGFTVATFMTACTTVGPDYQTPSIDLPSRFVDGDVATLGDVSHREWWRDLNDNTLDTLVARGMAQNLDVRAALERIEQANAVLRTTGQAAQITGYVEGSSLRNDDGYGVDTTDSISGNVSYVFDIFGGERRSREQATAQLESAVYDVGTARLAFLTELVSNYTEARYYQEVIALTRESIDTRRQTVELTETQLEVGVSSTLDTASAEALLNEALADLPSLEASFYSAVYGIATLLDEPAAPLVAELERGAPQPRPGGNSAAGVPADLLRNRPDILAVERDLAAATAAIGIATADLYPSLDLDGNVTASDPESWYFGPTLSLPILSQPALRAARDQQISLARESELTWRAAIGSAVQEVQTAQSSYQRLQQQVQAREAAAESYRNVLDISTAAYEAGTTSLLDLLEAVRSNAAAEISLAEAVYNMGDAWVTLQIASGKGWLVQETGG